ncbi:acid phosphatase det1 [Podila horticola]|nr:acid phosphatase det1 [Podila horticola]
MDPMDTSMEDVFTCPDPYIPPPRRPKQSLLASLRSRELGLNRRRSPVIEARRMYQSIYPNTTIHGVDCQFSNLKRFTPCGQYLIGMSKNQRSVHIYRFKGSGGPSSSRPVDSLGFKDFFELQHETVVLKESEMLSKDFCLVSANGLHIIVAAVTPCTGGPSDGRLYPCSLNCISNLDTFVFYVIELATGKIVDKREFKNEHITISYHSGVSLYDSLFAVMLVQSQAIQIIHIKNNGKLVDLHRIGWFNHDDDELELARYRDFNEQYIAQRSNASSAPYYHNGFSIKDDDYDARIKDRFDILSLAPSAVPEFAPDASYHLVPTNSGVPAGAASRNLQAHPSYITQISYGQSHHDEPHSQTISGIKQRLMTFLFRKAFNANDGGAALRQFHLTFQQFANLVMWRMQFLDESTMLIKFGKLDCVIGRQADSTFQTAFFVVYNIHTTQIQEVYDNASEEFLRIYESCADQFCAIAYSTAGPYKRHYSSTCSNNIYTKDLLRKTQFGMRHARNGGSAQAVKRSLCVLPFSPQSFSDSPYFDLSLFSYDEKVISATDRQRPCQDFPIKFYLRDSGELKFKIQLFHPNGGTSGSSFMGMPGIGPGMDPSGGLGGGVVFGTGGPTSSNNVNNTFINNNNNGNNNNGPLLRSKRFATFIAHPTEPFLISVIHQHLQPVTVNFHIRIPDSDLM